MSTEGIALADLCKAVGLHSSTTFHLVRTLVQLDYASQHPETKKYRIGRKLCSLAAAALDENELVARATPMIQQLAEYTGESSHFAIRSGDDVVIVARTEGSGMFQLTDRAGAVRPANATALGKVLLAALAPEQLDRYLARNALDRFTPKTITDPAVLRSELDEVRRSGFAFDDGEYSAEVRCVAVPVYDFLGQVAGAIGISAPMWRLSLQALHEKAPRREGGGRAVGRTGLSRRLDRQGHLSLFADGLPNAARATSHPLAIVEGHPLPALPVRVACTTT